MSTELERGDIFFFYRPRVGRDEVRSLEDVQRFFMLLHPQGSSHVREIVVGTKRLPDVERHERGWAFVARVSRGVDFREELERRTYQTKTRGERVQAATRPAGEGRYAIVDHGDHSHLAYVLELPHDPGEAQRMLRIGHEASYIVAVRNPEAPAPPGMDPPARAPDLPERLRTRFGRRRFAQLDTTEWLEHEGVELVMIGAATAAARELGIELDAEAEAMHHADLFETLRLKPQDLSVEPIRSGRLR
jgi:hypothetical protein